MNACSRIACALALTLPAGAGAGGYLAMIGPAPLRFNIARPAPELPPLKMSDDMADAAFQAFEYGPPAVPGTAAETGEEKHQEAGHGEEPAVEADQSFIGPMPQAAAPATVDKAMLTPRVFLRFFTPAATNATPVIAAPIEFTPPASTPRASSTATYEQK